MSVDYVKRPAARAQVDADTGRRERSEVTSGQTTALAAVHSSLLRLERTLADVRAAQATNDDRMRKNVRVPWREFFAALDQHTAHVRTMLGAFRVG